MQRIKIYPEKGFSIPQEIPLDVWNAYEQLVSLGFESGRMKTGTPPRIDGRSLHYDKMEVQLGDDPIGKFSHPTIEILKNGIADGALTGGCLSLLSASLGTPYEVDTEGKILFLEEVNEPPYRIDRMLTHLKMAGKFKKIKGILFGTLLNCDPPPNSGYTLKEVVLSSLDDVGCPVLWGVPFGHGKENITLPLGLKVQLNGDERTITFLESPVQ